MFNVTPKGNNRLNIEISGKIDSFDMKTALNQLLTASENIQHGTMLYQLNEIDLPTVGAVAMELMYLPDLFKLIKRFDRVAVVTDKKWVQQASKIENLFIPGVDIKAFDSKSIDAAEAWLAN